MRRFIKEVLGTYILRLPFTRLELLLVSFLDPIMVEQGRCPDQAPNFEMEKR
jgi:hypothetical protein